MAIFHAVTVGQPKTLFGLQTMCFGMMLWEKRGARYFVHTASLFVPKLSIKQLVGDYYQNGVGKKNNMRKKISGWTYENKKQININLVTSKDKLEETDDFELEFILGEERSGYHLRPDEMVLLIKILSDALLERVIGYGVNRGKLTKKDYKLKDFYN